MFLKVLWWAELPDEPGKPYRYVKWLDHRDMAEVRKLRREHPDAWMVPCGCKDCPLPPDYKLTDPLFDFRPIEA